MAEKEIDGSDGDNTPCKRAFDSLLFVSVKFEADLNVLKDPEGD